MASLSTPALKKLFAVLALSFVMAAGLAFVPRSSTAAAPKLSGAWRGHAERADEHRFKAVTIHRCARADFWFRIDAAGKVSGRAVVRYFLRLDDRKFARIVANANRIGNSAMALAPLVGGLLSAGTATTDVLGLRVAFDVSMPVREGAIKGKLQNNELSLDWAVKPKSLKYKIFTTAFLITK